MRVQTFDSVDALLQQLQEHLMPIWVMSNTTPWPAHKLGKQKKKMVRHPALRPACASVGSLGCSLNCGSQTDASCV